MKRIAIGRKNWLFVGSVRAGMRNANIMTPVASSNRPAFDAKIKIDGSVRLRCDGILLA